MMDLWWLANGELVDSRAIGASPYCLRRHHRRATECSSNGVWHPR